MMRLPLLEPRRIDSMTDPRRFGVAILAVVLLGLCSCERETTTEINQITSPAATFVGSDACQACHAEIHERFMKTGHPFQLNDAVDAQQQDYYPFSTVENPPSLPWNEIQMVIGGFWWKARYIGGEGRVYTGPDKQYNLRLGPDDPGSAEFARYETDADSTMDYTCGPCHTTGYRTTDHQNDKPGLLGTWAFNGIQCEACHGPGGRHVTDPRHIDMVIDRSNELCGRCHVRGPVNEIPAGDGFLHDHAQWNEMFTTKHQALRCVTCHDPHRGLHPLNPDRDLAIRIGCDGCHFQEAQRFRSSPLPHHERGLNCIDCHMPKAGRSAAAPGDYVGDVRSHLWRINPDAGAEMFSPDGGVANGYLTTDFTCRRCHPTKTPEQLEIAAPVIH